MRVAALTLLVVLGIEAVAPWPAAADELVPGTRVRITGDWHGGRRKAGSFIALERDSISIWARPRVQDPFSRQWRLAPDSTRFAAPETQLRRVEVSRGVHPMILSGAVTGFVVGAGLGLLLGLTAPNNDSHLTRGQILRGATIGFGIAGMSFGAVLGSIEVEQWRTVTKN